MSEEYDVYSAPDADLPWELGGPGGPDEALEGGDSGIVRAPAEGGWCVVVEFAARKDDRPTTVVRVLEDDLATREQAHRSAESHAFAFEPPDPWSLQSREVYEDGGGFLTILHGAASTFHFTTRVVRFAGAGARSA